MGFCVFRRSCETHSEYASKMSGCDRCGLGTNKILRPENGLGQRGAQCAR
ncbi:Bgt-51179 [Blumeria graminis f. sp. tritici]|uniref:Bgt-51179 n=1 Tax=Blumeria graminis f. sp. tritici TaxID=62690 RepID=A0A9X9MJR8_BLUGR|nr:Bgt-51179 [Blumeria graminis f. sp. tritici]